MTVGILSDIITKVRELTNTPNSNQLTDEKIIKYVNSYYLLDLPDDLKILKLKDTYSFFTIKGIDTYAFDFDNWTNIEPPVFVRKRNITMMQDPFSFWNYNFNEQALELFATGDGGNTYTGTLSSTPIVRSVNTDPTQTTFPAGRIINFMISASNDLNSTQTIVDKGDGTLIDPVTGAARGTINYDTGVITAIFGSNVNSGIDINAQYISRTLGIPDTILFYQQQFVLRPVPDQAYLVEMSAYRDPSQALMGTTSNTSPTLTGRPELYDWWELIAFGVAKKIYQDRQDMDGVQMMDGFLEEKISEARTTTYGQLGKQRIGTIFSQQLDSYYYQPKAY